MNAYEDIVMDTTIEGGEFTINPTKVSFSFAPKKRWYERLWLLVKLIAKGEIEWNSKE